MNWQLGVSVFPDNATAYIEVGKRHVAGEVDGVEHRLFKFNTPWYQPNSNGTLVVEAAGYQTSRHDLKIGPDNPDEGQYPYWPELPAVHLHAGTNPIPVPPDGKPWQLGISIQPPEASVEMQSDGHLAGVQGDGPNHRLLQFTTPPFTPGAPGTLAVACEGFTPVTQEYPSIGPNNPDSAAYPYWPELPAIALQPIAPEPPIPPEPPTPGHARQGLVRAEGRATRDDTGMFHPLGTTFFWAMQGWKHDRERMQQNARWVQSKGFDYVRILCEVGWSVDPPGPIDPTTWPDYDQILVEVVNYFYDTLGMRVELTVRGGGTSVNLTDLSNRIASLMVGREDKILDIECANEYDRVNPTIEIQTMIPMADAFMSKLPNRVALSSPGSWGDLNTTVQQGHGNAFTFHSDRGPGDYKWRQVRQGYDCKDVRHWLSSNEPPGPGSSVSVNDNPLQLTMLRAVSVLCGGSAWVFHTGTGVFGNGQPGATGPRPANFWEIDNIDAIVDPIRRVDALLPEGLENWQIANTQWTPPNPVSPFQMNNHWPPGDSGVNKAYSALSGDGRWVQLPCGVLNQVEMTASYNLHNVVVYDPLTHAVVQSHPFLGGGQKITLPGAADTMSAYIVHGTR